MSSDFDDYDSARKGARTPQSNFRTGDATLDTVSDQIEDVHEEVAERAESIEKNLDHTRFLLRDDIDRVYDAVRSRTIQIKWDLQEELESQTDELNTRIDAIREDVRSLAPKSEPAAAIDQTPAPAAVPEPPPTARASAVAPTTPVHEDAALEPPAGTDEIERARGYCEDRYGAATPEQITEHIHRRRAIERAMDNDPANRAIRARVAANQLCEFQRKRARRMSIANVASERDKFTAHAVDELAAGRLSFMDAAREAFRVQHGTMPPMAPDDTARWALGATGAELATDRPVHGPGDFPNILSGLANKILDEAEYDATVTYHRWAHQTKPVKDFKNSTLIAAGEFGEFPQHIDGDNFEQSTFQVEHGSLAIDSYGDEFVLTPRMVLDDDLGAFEERILDKKAAHDLTLNRLLVNLLVENVALSDGYELFDNSQHGNDIADGAAPDTDQLSAMRLKLRKQLGISGVRKMGYGLSLLLVPEDLETVTEKLVRATLNVTPTTADDAEPFRGLDWAVEPMLGEHSALTYYGFAPVKRARSIVFGHQIGYEKMRLRKYYSPSNNCLHWQCEGRFGCGVRNYRGVVRNAGEAAA